MLRAGTDPTGLVYRDLNGNRRMDADEPIVAGAVVEMASGASCVTDRSGRYLLRGVATGAHALAIARKQPWLKDTSDLRLRPLPLPLPTAAAAATAAATAKDGAPASR